MKRSFIAVAAVTALAVAACGPTETDQNIEPVEEVQPAPAPMPMPVDTPMIGDTLLVDTIPQDGQQPM